MTNTFFAVRQRFQMWIRVRILIPHLLAALLVIQDAESAQPPVILSVQPAPGLVTNLSRIKVGFSKTVTGVQAQHFLVNDRAVTNVTGSGTQYEFSFPPAPFGTLLVRFGNLHNIADREVPPNRFDANAPGSVWSYLNLDPSNPTISSRQPTENTTLRSLSEIEITFTRPITGLEAGSLLINGQPATQVSGAGAGPYLFRFPAASAGTASVSWAANHGIVSDEPIPRPFTGLGWSYTIDPEAATPRLVLSEILAENLNGRKDEDADPEDWIEIHNRGSNTVNLAGWALSVDSDDLGQWVFPSTNLPPSRFLMVWASGKNRRTPGKPLHTSFKLNPNGETLLLSGPDLPRQSVDELSYPGQSPDFSYARTGSNDVWRYFATPTFGASNGLSSVTGQVEQVHFSVNRGFFNTPFNLSLHCPTPGAVIRYTTNGSPASAINGLIYSGPIPIRSTRIIRATAFLTNHVPARLKTATYLYNLPALQTRLPALSLVTASNNLFGTSGIMEFQPRNTDKHGAGWERPVSVEFIRPEDNSGFVVDAGLRVQGGGYIRSLYNYTMGAPQGKYSFRLYFRGEYGQGRLNYPWFPNTTVDSFDTVVLRAGQNDHTNPYLRDELARQLASDVGQPASHGTFVNLFLNGVYKGYYNPVERIETEFLQAYHGGVNTWDVIGSVSELRDGDLVAWNQLMSLVQNRPATNNSNYLAIASRLDLVNFVDYLLVPIYADTDDWPHNNWRAARERVPGGKIRFYVWDAEQSFGVAHDYNYNTINGQLSNTSPPWGAPEIATIFNSLKRHPEFKQLFADRVHKHLFNGGALTDQNIRRTYNLVKAAIAPSISGFDDSIYESWIPNRRNPLLSHLRAAGFLASTNAPGLNRFGGVVPSGFQLIMTNLFGTIYFTTNGEDPRIPITGAVADGSSTYTQPLTLTTPITLRARSLSGTNWSALTEASFSIGGLGIPLRISEIMYHPADDEAFEFVELINAGSAPLDVSGFSFNGIDFRFGTPSPKVKPGERIVIASDANTNAFLSYYPNVIVSGWFGGSLNNAGERLTLTDLNGYWIDSVPFNDKLPWPPEADGSGASLERTDVWAPSDLPDSWHASSRLGGTPGLAPSLPASPGIHLREVFPGSEGSVGWVELFNPGSSAVSLNGWRLREESQRVAFVFPSSVAIAPQQFLIVYCDDNPGHPGLHSGFKLDPTGGTVTLTDAAGRRQDVVTFGSLPSGGSLGRTGGFGAWELCEPSPAASNESVPLGPPSGLVLNEFLANSDQGYDWIEIHNVTNAPISLLGCYLATSNNLYRIAAPIFAPAGGFVVLRADEEPGIDHLPFKLPSTPGTIALHDPSGALVSRVNYARQLSAVATGRVPDGSGSWMSLPFSASPGRSNYLTTLGSALRFNEIMAAAAEGTSGDWIELFNASSNTIELDGYSITLESPSLSSWRFPNGITISPGSYQIIDCTPRASSPGRLDLGQELPDLSGSLTLQDAQGRVIDQIRYGFQISNRTIGRAANEWRLLTSPSPGAVNTGAATLGDLRFVRFNEWLSGGWQGEDWFELFNPGSNAVNLAGCFLSDDPSLGGISNALISPLTFIPAQGFVRFFANDSTERGSHHLPFRLDMLGETLRLYSPTRTVVESIDLLVQLPGVSEGLFPDGSTNVIRFPGTATPGASNRRFIDTDADGMPDDWEVANGFDPRDPSTAAQDSDGDGLSNLDEYRSDTDPRNPGSALRLSVSQISESSIQLNFRAAAGRSYQIQTKDSLAELGWRLLKTIGPSGEVREVTVREDRQAPESKARFYRVVLE